MKNQRLALGTVATAALLLPACGGSDGPGTGAGGSSGPMDLIQVSSGFVQLLPHTVQKLDAAGNPTPTVIPIRTDNDLINNVTATNLVRPVPVYQDVAILPSSAPGNHFMYAEFTRPIDIDSVLSNSPGAQANSGLLGTITLVSIDPTTGSASPVSARVLVNGQTYSGAPVGSPPVLPLQTWVTLSSGGHPIAVDADPDTAGDQLPGFGFPGTQGGFNGDAKLVSPNTIVFVADVDGNLATHETFPSGREIKLRISTAVRATSGNFLKRQALACTTVGPDTFRPEVATTPPPLNLPLVSPGNGDLDVDPLTKIRIEFTEPVQPTTIGSLPTGSPPIVSASVRVQFGPASAIVIVPFTVMPVSVFDLTTFELTPAFNFPGQGPSNLPCNFFNKIDISVNPNLISDLSANINQLAASTNFYTGEGPGLVNVPVTPDAIYVGRAGAVPGLSVIDLNGFGGSTGNPQFDITNPVVEGASNFPNNPNVKLQGSLLYPPLQGGQCTVNGGSAGVFTLTTDSSLDNKVVRAPLVASINDMMLGHALDGTFNNGPAPFGCQSGGGNLCAFDGKKLIVPLINGNTMTPNTGATQPNQTIQPGSENLQGWAPHPNPPPLVFPPLCISPLIGGQEPTSVISALPPLLGGQGLTNLLVSGNYFGDPANGVPPSGLLTPEDNAFFEGPSPPQATINGCATYMMRQQVGHFLYVIDRARREIVVFNSNRMTVIDRIPTQDPTTLAMSPNLNLLAVTNQLADLVSFIDIDPNSGNFHQVVQETIVGNRPRGIAWDPGNEDILVCNEGEDTMSILSAASLTVRRVVSSQLSDPFDVAITPRQQGFGFFRNVYFAYILNRNGSVAMFESGPNQVNGWGYDDVIGIAPATFRNPKAIQPDHIDLRSAVWIAHEGPIDAQTGAPGNFGIGAVSKLVIVSGVIGQVPLVNQAFPQFRDMALGVQVSIGTPDISGVPVDIAFDDLRTLSGLPGLVTAFSVGSPASTNSKQLVRGNPLTASVQNNNEPRYMFIAVPNPTSGTGVVDVVRIDQGFARVDTNAFHAGIQSVPVVNCQVVMDYFRQ